MFVVDFVFLYFIFLFILLSISLIYYFLFYFFIFFFYFFLFFILLFIFFFFLNIIPQNLKNIKFSFQPLRFLPIKKRSERPLPFCALALASALLSLPILMPCYRFSCACRSERPQARLLPPAPLGGWPAASLADAELRELRPKFPWWSDLRRG